MVEWIGSLSNCGRTCLPNAATASLQTSPGHRRAEHSEAELVGADVLETLDRLGHLVGVAHRDVPTLDLLLDLIGRLVGDGLRPDRDARRPREGVEVPEDETQVVADVEVVEDLARPAARLRGRASGS